MKAEPVLCAEGGKGEAEVARAIEDVILRRLRENRIEGYTLEMSKEIARIAALTASSQPASARNLTAEEHSLVRSALIDSSEPLYDVSTYEGKAEPVAYERMRDGLLVDVWQYETAEDDQSGYRPLYAHPPGGSE